MIGIAALIVAVVGVTAIVLVALKLDRTLRSLDDTMQTLRTERHHRREPPVHQPTPRVTGSHPVIKVMAFGTGASRAARHLRER